ncbi:MAG: hypothetical protein RBT47_07860 [Anaerolineae bacterium]|jgi:hypothetical protein|nr:hypothetical protein [Anaerolineae bacterium]
MGKYDPLSDFLKAIADHVTEMTLTFEQIERLIEDRLPPSARSYRAWWANPTSIQDHPYAQAWLAAGWRVETVNLQEGWVRLRRI